jgi:hypothetical protein
MSILNPELSNPLTRSVPLPVSLLTMALLVGGLIGGISNLLFVPPGFWVWEMPVLAYRFLAAAAFAYVAGSLITLMLGRWAESELLIATVNFYGWPLLIAILLDADKIDWSRFVTWAFLLVVLPALVISITYLSANRYRTSSEAQFLLSKGFRLYLLIIGLAALLVGLLVYVAPKQAGFVWPWSELKAWRQLDSRLIASMLLTIAGGSFLVNWRNDRRGARVFLVMLAAYCIMADIGIALHAWATPAFVEQDTIYIIIFGMVLAIGLVLYKPISPTKQPAP